MDWSSFIDSENLEHLEYEAFLPLYEEALGVNARDLGALYWLGHAYTRLGRIEDGLAVDLRLSVLLPEDPTVRYNLGCSYALLGRRAQAFDSLELAVELGYEDPTHLREDEDLASLRGEQRFQALVRTLEDR